MSLVFPEKQLKALHRFPLDRRKVKVKSIFDEIIKSTDYVSVDSDKKHELISELKDRCSLHSPDLAVGWLVGILLFLLLVNVPHVGGVLGGALLLLCIYLGNQSYKGNPIVIFSSLCVLEEESQLAAKAELLQSRADQTQEIRNKRAAEAKAKSQQLYDEIRANPSRLKELFAEYKASVDIETAHARPFGKPATVAPADLPKFWPLLAIFERERQV